MTKVLDISNFSTNDSMKENIQTPEPKDPVELALDAVELAIKETIADIDRLEKVTMEIAEIAEGALSKDGK